MAIFLHMRALDIPAARGKSMAIPIQPEGHAVVLSLE